MTMSCADNYDKAKLKSSNKMNMANGVLRIEIQKNGGGVQINALGEVPHQI